MQVKPAPASCCRRPRVDGTDDPTALERLRRIERIDTLRREDGFTLRQALKAVELPRSTCCDWRKALRERGVAGLVPKSRRPFRSPGPRWTKRDERRVLAARDARPYCGKHRIHHELERRKGGCGIGASTVGRILQRAGKRGRIRPCAFLRGRVAPKRRRDFANGHARRWKHDERATAPGQLVRRAACGTHRPHDRAPRRRRAQGGSGGLFESAPSAPRQAHVRARPLQRAASSAPPPHSTPAASSATSSPSCASSPCRSTAAAGSCAIHGAPRFEGECRKRDIDLAVLPPRRPRWNGCGRGLLEAGAPTTPPAPGSGASASATSPSTPPTPSTSTTSATATNNGPTAASA